MYIYGTNRLQLGCYPQTNGVVTACVSEGIPTRIQSALTFINFHLVGVFERKKSRSRRSVTGVHKPSRPVEIRRTCCEDFGAENLYTSSPLCVLLSEHSADRLSVCSNQKFIQSCSGSLRLATTMRSPPLLLRSALAIPTGAAVLYANEHTAQSRESGAKRRMGGLLVRGWGREGERCSGNRIGWAFQRQLFSASNWCLCGRFGC